MHRIIRQRESAIRRAAATGNAAIAKATGKHGRCGIGR